MVERSRIRLLAGALASVALPGLWGCHDPFYEGPPPTGYPPYHYDYYYYPQVGVYFHLYSGWYHYRDGGRWLRVRRLPPRIYLDPRHRHVLRIPEREPWRRHEEHRRRYAAPPPRRGEIAPGRPQPSPRRDGGPRARPAPPADPGRGAARGRAAPPSTQDRRRERESDREEREHNIRRNREFRERDRSPRGN